MIIHGDCLKWLGQSSMVQAIIADPPDNLGLRYDGYVDHRPDYYPWLKSVVDAAAFRATHFWLSYYWRHDLEVSSMAAYWQRQGYDWKKYIWRYTFGQHRESDCGSGFRYLLRLSKPGAFLQTSSIRVPSARQTCYNDKRANPNGRVPDDVWDFPRIVGNAHERREWHPTQHPEGVYCRIVRLSSEPGDTVVDLFGGTGTLLRVGRQLPGRKLVVVDQSRFYCDKMSQEHKCPVINL